MRPSTAYAGCAFTARRRHIAAEYADHPLPQRRRIAFVRSAFREISAADSRTIRTACRHNPAAENLDRAVALDPAAANARRIVRPAHGKIRRRVIDEIRDRKRRAVRHVQARTPLSRARKAVRARESKLDDGIGKNRNGRCRGDGRCRDPEIRDDSREAVREHEADVARRVRAGNRAAVGEDGKKARIDGIRPPLAGLQRDIHAIDLDADGPDLRLGVRAVDNRAVRLVRDVDVVFPVRQPDVDFAFVVRHRARKRIAGEIGHCRADVEVRAPDRNRHAIDILT